LFVTASTILGRSSKGGSEGNLAGVGTRSTLVGTVDRADRGNQPIHGRVDTISKQYRVSSTTGQ
jgi:hypothetical protein